MALRCAWAGGAGAHYPMPGTGFIDKDRSPVDSLNPLPYNQAFQNPLYGTGCGSFRAASVF
jgi:hypothetical protein